ncbi:hypothetical protein CY652_06555 [Burkholderia sp. WAC0059]|nr:hypothetical protein CY652_06555 [Burkholderia sp. WAC0059]
MVLSTLLLPDELPLLLADDAVPVVGALAVAAGVPVAVAGVLPVVGKVAVILTGDWTPPSVGESCSGDAEDRPEPLESDGALPEPFWASMANSSFNTCWMVD